MSREVRVRPATDQVSLGVVCASNLAASDEVHDLYAIPVGQNRGRPKRARHDGEIAFDGDLALVQAEQGDQGRDVPLRLDLALFSIHGQPHAASL
jgi:hypothetical protein